MGSSNNTPAHTTQTTKVELPAWVDQASQQNYKFAEEVGKGIQNRPEYTGERVAGLTDLEKAAPGTLQAGMNVSNANLATATGAATAATNFDPTNVNAAKIDPAMAAKVANVQGPQNVQDVIAQSFLSRDINAYMDPNLQSVINPTMENMQRNITLQNTAIGDQATGGGAFGGSRHGIAEAVNRSEGTRNMAATEAGLRSAAFTDAAGRIMGDNAAALQAGLANQSKDVTTNAQRISVGQGNQSTALQAALANQGATNAARTNNASMNMQAQLANQAAGISGANINLAGGQLAGSTAQTAADVAGRNSILQQQFGANERAITQANNDVKYQEFLRQNGGADQEALNVRLAALGMSPYGKTTSAEGTSTPASSTNPLMTGVGAAATLLPLLFSDRKVKKDVKRVGKVPGTDLNAYEFKYKKGFMGRDTGPQVGLMADDVRKKVPGAVHKVKVNGETVDAVDYAKAVGARTRDKRDDKGKIRGTYKPRVGVSGHARG